MRTALLNMKPGVGKTTSSVNLAFACAALGRRVLLVDADMGGSLTRWVEIAGGFGELIDVISMPKKTIGAELRQLVTRGHWDDIVIDCPQMEDHAPIVRSAMAFVAADQVERGAWLIPLAPSKIELDRMVQVGDAMDEVGAGLERQPRRMVMLNRCNRARRTKTGPDAEMAQALTDLGYQVCPYQAATSDSLYRLPFGTNNIPLTGTPFPALAADLIGANAMNPILEALYAG